MKTPARDKVALVRTPTKNLRNELIDILHKYGKKNRIRVRTWKISPTRFYCSPPDLVHSLMK